MIGVNCCVSFGILPYHRIIGVSAGELKKGGEATKISPLINLLVSISPRNLDKAKRKGGG